ncbi:HAMP domain-containing sensor histidine kinase [soil metagenome]
MTTRRVLVITGAVIALSAFVLLLAGKGARDALTLSLGPGGAALAVGGAGAAILDRLRHRPFVQQETAVTLAAVGAAAAGALVAAMTMSFSTDELLALAVAIVTAGTVGIISGLALAARVMRAAATLEDAARSVGGTDEPGIAAVEIFELAGVGDELESAAARVVAERARRQLVSWVSHDLRSPLAGIGAIADALADDSVVRPIDEDLIARHVRRLRMETERLTHLVDDLAQLNRVESGQLQLELEEVSLSDLVSDAVAAAEPVAESKGVHVRGAVRTAPPTAPLAAREISRVFANLLDNAVRATPRGGTVDVEVDADEAGALVVITDECGGLRHQPDRTRSGLGLVIARGFIEAHGGDLSVSDVGTGCRHVVRIPHPT